MATVRNAAVTVGTTAADLVPGVGLLREPQVVIKNTHATNILHVGYESAPGTAITAANGMSVAAAGGTLTLDVPAGGVALRAVGSAVGTTYLVLYYAD